MFFSLVHTANNGLLSLSLWSGVIFHYQKLVLPNWLPGKITVNYKKLYSIENDCPKFFLFDCVC